jgi:outer membrane receptor protein involved in Fe transport
MKGIARAVLLTAVLLAAALPTLALAQSGKIAGRVMDASLNEPLPGVNILIQGTLQGTVTDIDGYYVILNVTPGVLALRASFVGFTSQTVEGVRIQIDQTTTINFTLAEEVLQGEEIVVTAARPVVQRDVSNSQMNVDSEQIEALPVSTVASVIGLQAGVQGLSIRGSGSDEISFNLNGLNLQDERTNAPYTNISLASVEEVQVQTGGFNAEYGNVRSGVVNVITKEGSKDRYEADVILRYSPPAQKNIGQLANDPNSYWIRPFLDPDVAWTGTESGAWDSFTQAQFPRFEGWVAVAEARIKDQDPSNDLTPEALQQAFLFQHRKQMEITRPDYNIDLGVGGPVPGGKALGNARFFASFRQDQNMYAIPLNTDRSESQSAHIKFTSDVGSGMKLTIEAMAGASDGTASSRSGAPGLFSSASSIASQLSRVSFIDTRIFSTDYWTPYSTKTALLGAKFTHALDNVSYYEIRATRFASRYDSNPGQVRDSTVVATFGGVGFDEAPFGFEARPSFGVGGMRTGVGMSNSRDTSRVVVYNLKVDYTRQMNRFFQMKSGIEFNMTDSRVNYGRFDAFLPSSNSVSSWNRSPTRGAAYAQGKLEFQGMVANLGLRLDYFRAGGDWFEFDSFTPAFSASQAAGIDTLLTQNSTDFITTLSPRLGVSFPITELSKLFFNYGHFRSMPDPNNLFLLREFSETGQISRIANPNNPLPKTVAYEVGFEQSLAGQFLVRLAGYYKDVSSQPFLVRYTSRDGQTQYTTTEPNSFEDIRGFEFTFARNRGRWVQGFFNYTYSVFTSGYFGFRRVSENKTAQREFEASDSERRRASSNPVPRPFARLNIDILTPEGFGPQLLGGHPLAGWRSSILSTWQAGSKFTWTGGGSVPGVLNNVQFRDNWNVDLRFTRNIQVKGRRAQIFVDVFNLLNRRTLTFSGFVDGNDQNLYLQSLHLPESDDYPNIPGSDRIGEYRRDGVAYQPMLGIQSRDQVGVPLERAMYYEFASSSYLEFVDDSWRQVEQSRVDAALEDKAYIDMPNQGFLTFLNPRDIYVGVRFSF